MSCIYLQYTPSVRYSLHTLFWYRHTHMTFPPPEIRRLGDCKMNLIDIEIQIENREIRSWLDKRLEQNYLDYGNPTKNRTCRKGMEDDLDNRIQIENREIERGTVGTRRKWR